MEKPRKGAQSRDRCFGFAATTRLEIANNKMVNVCRTEKVELQSFVVETIN
jgi:hypothetical protein